MIKRLLMSAAVCATLLAPGAASADSICFQTGLEILGEPWLAHRQCVVCGIFPNGDCLPPGLPIGDLPSDSGNATLQLPHLP